MKKLLASIEEEQRNIHNSYNAIKRNLTAGHYSDVVALGRALNGAARSQVAEKLQNEWRSKGGR
jgi:hypothetical protein